MSASTLSDLLEFPCDYLFKAFGPAAAEERFDAAVHRAVCEVVPVPLDAVRSRLSSGGRYLCVSVVVRVEVAGQVEAIYAGLRRLENLQFLL